MANEIVAGNHFILCTLEIFTDTEIYRNDPMFLDRYAWANSADPDQTPQRSSLIRVYTVCLSVCIVYSMIEPHSSNFRAITTNFLDV